MDTSSSTLSFSKENKSMVLSSSTRLPLAEIMSVESDSYGSDNFKDLNETVRDIELEVADLDTSYRESFSLS
jgi:hypothetical protein